MDINVETALNNAQDTRAWLNRAHAVIPNGVSSFARKRDEQIVFTAASGAHLFDVEGKQYVDCVLGFGPLFLGHRHPAVTAAVTRVVQEIDLSGGVTPLEIELAERLASIIPCAEKIVFLSSGSEAVHLALRTARATTGRRIIVKFTGHYHGWLDPVYAPPPSASFVNAGSVGSGASTQQHPGHSSRPDDVLALSWGDIASLQHLMSQRGAEIAAVIMEPIPYNFGAFPLDPEYLAAVRALCSRHGALLIFDEVVSGFRLAPGGAQEVAGVTPDLALFGKAIGSGHSIAFVAGTNHAMQSIISGEVRQAGTYNGSPIGMAAGSATLDVILADPEFYATVNRRAEALQVGIRRIAEELNLPVSVNRVGTVLQTFWGLSASPHTYEAAIQSDVHMIKRWFEGASAHGAYLAPRGLLYVSAAHSEDDVELVINALRNAAMDLGFPNTHQSRQSSTKEEPASHIPR